MEELVKQKVRTYIYSKEHFFEQTMTAGLNLEAVHRGHLCNKNRKRHERGFQYDRSAVGQYKLDNSHGMRKEGYVLPVPDRVPADTRQKLCTLDLEKIFSDYFKSPEIMETLGQRVTEEVSNLQRLNLWFSTLLF